MEGSGAFLWVLPELTTVRVRVLGLEDPAPGPWQFRWRRRDHGDQSAHNRGSLGRVSFGVAPTAVVELTGMGYAGEHPAPAAQPATDGVELDLPLGTFELLLNLDGDPDPELERIITLPADAPDGVLTLAL